MSNCMVVNEKCGHMYLCICATRKIWLIQTIHQRVADKEGPSVKFLKIEILLSAAFRPVLAFDQDFKKVWSIKLHLSECLTRTKYVYGKWKKVILLEHILSHPIKSVPFWQNGTDLRCTTAPRKCLNGSLFCEVRYG